MGLAQGKLYPFLERKEETYGLLRLNYIKTHKKQLYRNLLMNNQLTDYLSLVSKECDIKFETMMNNYKKKDKRLSVQAIESMDGMNYGQ